MPYDIFSQPVTDQLRAVRREFERQMNGRNENQTGLTIAETEDSVLVSLDLPGVPEDAVEVTVHDGVLTVSGERKLRTPDGAKIVSSTQHSGEFSKSLRLDDSIDPETVDAVMEHGMLTITMSRRPELQPRKVTVRSANVEG